MVCIEWKGRLNFSLVVVEAFFVICFNGVLISVEFCLLC